MDDYTESNDSDSNNTECFLKMSQVRIIRLTALVCGSFSLVCCLLIICLVAILKKHRTTTQRVILYLTITVTLVSLVYMLHGIQELTVATSSHAYCVTTAFLDQIIGWMQGLAILVLNFDLVIKVVTQNFQTKRRYEIAYIVVIFIVPLLFNWIPFIHNTFGNAGAYCWINNFNYTRGHTICDKEDINLFGVGLQFGLFWIPYTIVIAVSVIMYMYALCRLRLKRHAYTAIFNPTEQINRNLLYSEIRQYMYYTIVVVFTNAVGVTSRIVDAASTEKIFFSLQLLHILSISLQGMPIAVVFVLDSDTRKDLFHWQKFKAALYTFFCYCRLQKVEAYGQIFIESGADSVPNAKSI